MELGCTFILESSNWTSSFQEGLYEFRCLFFGLSSAPIVFTMIMKTMLKRLRREGWTSVIYLDDFLYAAKNYNDCQQDTRETIAILKSLDFLINLDKRSLICSRTCKFLGVVVNSADYNFALYLERKENLYFSIEKSLSSHTCKILQLESLIGNHIFAYQGEYGLLHTRRLEKDKIKVLLEANDNFKI